MSTTLIRPRQGWQPLDLKDLWRYRELLWFLALRDVKVRYKQTLLGVSWAVLQPVLTVLVLGLFFGRLGGLAATVHGVPYSVFVFAGVLLWQMFAQSLTALGNSMVTNQSLITKTYFPRIVLPLSAVVPILIDLGVGFLTLVTLMAFRGVTPAATVVFVPLFVALGLLASLSVGVWLAALNVEYRDIRHALPYIVQIWMFATPVAYPSGIVPHEWRVLYGLNPMVSILEGFRWALLGQPAPPARMLLLSTAVVILLLLTALAYFRRVERSFADVI